MPPLKYADDDAASYLDLFRVLGARTYLLSRLDDNTRRLHAQAAAEALEPRRAAFEQAVAQITADVTRARDRQVETVLYIVYAGHGNVRDGEGYVTLEDMRITGADLARIVASIPATRVHVIVDACASYYLAYSRGPGGERRPLSGFQDSSQLASDPRVGLLLSTSSARESHEWDGFQAGVFSHEVRSGLYGGRRRGRRRSRELPGNRRVHQPGERRHPQRTVPAASPRAGTATSRTRCSTCVTGSNAGSRSTAAHAAHYWLEDSRGVRLLDVHNGDGQAVHIVRPSPDGPIYVRRADDDTEFVLPRSPDVVSLADLEVVRRGWPLAGPPTRRSISSSRCRSIATSSRRTSSRRRRRRPLRLRGCRESIRPRRIRRRVTATRLAWGAVGLGAVGVGVGVGLSISASTVAGGSSRQESEADVAHRNTRISALDTGAVVSFVAGGLSVATGVTLLLWPDSPHLKASLLRSGGYVGYGSAF